MAFFDCLALDAVFHVLNVELKAGVAFIVDGDAPGKVVPVGFLEAENVGHTVMQILNSAGGGGCRQHEPPFGFFLDDRGNLPRPPEEKFRFLVGERNMHRIVFDVVKEIARGERRAPTHKPSFSKSG